MTHTRETPRGSSIDAGDRTATGRSRSQRVFARVNRKRQPNYRPLAARARGTLRALRRRSALLTGARPPYPSGDVMNQIKRLWLVSAFTLAACGEGPPDEQVGGTETLTFSSSDQALSWLAARARNRSGTHLLTDATGTVRSITFDNENARDGLLGEFDHFKVVRVASRD